MRSINSPVLIIAARSDIGAALAQAYAARGCSLILAARDPEALTRAKADLEIRHQVSVDLVACDVTDADPRIFFDRLVSLPGTVVMVAGLLGDEPLAADDPSITQKVMETNYNGPARMLLEAARRMAARRSGDIIGISSVAGDRGRASNFIYGSAKAGFTAFLSGLRNAMAGQGVHVLTVKPGYVATRMTAAMTLPAPLTAQPAQVAEAIVRAQQRGTNAIYVKAIWLPIMTIIRLIPERIFKRMNL